MDPNGVAAIAKLEARVDILTVELANIRTGFHLLRDDMNKTVPVLEEQLERIIGNGQPGELATIKEWIGLELKAVYAKIDTESKSLHGRISGVRDAMSVKQWAPLLFGFLSTVAACIAAAVAVHHG